MSSDADDAQPAEQLALSACYGAAASGLGLDGDRAGQPLLRIVDPSRARDGEPVADIMGFNVHAQVAVPARDRAKLERLCRYVCRPPIAQDRLEEQPSGKLRYTLKKPWKDGTVALVLEPLDLIARVCALVPPPRLHMVRYHGVLSSHAKVRSEVVPHPDVATSPARAVQLELFGDNEAGPTQRATQKALGLAAPARVPGGRHDVPALRRAHALARGRHHTRRDRQAPRKAWPWPSASAQGRSSARSAPARVPQDLSCSTTARKCRALGPTSILDPSPSPRARRKDVRKAWTPAPTAALQPMPHVQAVQAGPASPLPPTFFQFRKPYSHVERLNVLRKWTRDIESADPVQTARMLKLRSRRLNDVERLSQILVFVGPQKLSEILGSKARDDGAQQAARDSRSTAFNHAPLGGSGSATWRALWNAAREFSTREAYKEQSFPVTTEGSRCVLCQQELDESATDLLRGFDAHLRSPFEVDAAAAAKMHQSLVADLQNFDVRPAQVQDALRELSLEAEDAATRCEAVMAATEAAKLATLLAGSLPSGTQGEFAAEITALRSEVLELAQTVTARATEMEATAADESIGARRKELLELEARVDLAATVLSVLSGNRAEEENRRARAVSKGDIYGKDYEEEQRGDPRDGQRSPHE